MHIKRILAACLVAGMGLIGTASGANAVVYSFNNILLSDGGLLNGTLDIQFGGVIGYNLTTTGGTPGLDTSYTYPGFPSPNSIPFGSPTTIQLFPNSFTAVLQLAFASNLMLAGPNVLLGGINGLSFECNGSFSCPDNRALTRYVANDTAISPTPLPPAVLLFGTALAGLGLIRRRRKASTPVFG